MANAISSKKKSIAKDEKKIISLEEKLVKDTKKGKPSPLDIENIKSKIEKLKSGIVSNKEKLQKLIKKQ